MRILHQALGCMLVAAAAAGCNLLPDMTGVFRPGTTNSPNPGNPASAPEAQANNQAPAQNQAPQVQANVNVQSHSNHTSSTTIRREESLDVKVNGRHVDPNSLPGAQNRNATPTEKKGLKETCTKNAECGSGTCYVGYGTIGYCTKMCDSSFDCEFRWDCSRAGNSAQKICKQPKD